MTLSGGKIRNDAMSVYPCIPTSSGIEPGQYIYQCCFTCTKVRIYKNKHRYSYLPPPLGPSSPKHSMGFTASVKLSTTSLDPSLPLNSFEIPGIATENFQCACQHINNQSLFTKAYPIFRVGIFRSFCSLCHYIRRLLSPNVNFNN